jgi:hypothetical protein
MTMRVLPRPLGPITVLAFLLAAGLSGADDAWMLLGARTVSAAADHDTLAVKVENAVVGKLQLRVRGTAVRFERIVVRYAEGKEDRIELSRDEIPAGGESRTIALREDERIIRAVDLWYDAHSLGGRAAIIEVYGRR